MQFVNTLLLQVSRATIGRIVSTEKKKRRGEPLPAPKKRGRKSEITPDALVHLLLLLEDDSTITLKQMVDILEKDLHITTSTSALDRAFSKMDITWKNVLTIPYDWNTIEVLGKRQEFLRDIALTVGRPQVYIDESGFNLHVKKSKGRSLEGML